MMPEEPPVQVTADAVRQQVLDHLHIGNFYLDRGQYAEGIAELEKARALAPNDASVLAALKRAREAQ